MVGGEGGKEGLLWRVEGMHRAICGASCMTPWRSCSKRFRSAHTAREGAAVLASVNAYVGVGLRGWAKGGQIWMWSLRDTSWRVRVGNAECLHRSVQRTLWPAVDCETVQL